MEIGLVTWSTQLMTSLKFYIPIAIISSILGNKSNLDGYGHSKFVIFKVMHPPYSYEIRQDSPTTSTPTLSKKMLLDVDY